MSRVKAARHIISRAGAVYNGAAYRAWASTPLEHWGSQVERRRSENRGAVGGEGVGLGRDCAPSQKIHEFFISKWCDMVHSGCVVFKIHVSHGLSATCGIQKFR